VGLWQEQEFEQPLMNTGKIKLEERYGTVRSHTFSVVTPNYNMGEYLGRTIESVIRNLRPGDQYFVINGGSTNNSIEII
jgi:hypothetical protein